MKVTVPETEKYTSCLKSTCLAVYLSLLETQVIGRYRVREWENGIELLNVGSEFVHLNDGSSFGVYHVPKR